MRPDALGPWWALSFPQWQGAGKNAFPVHTGAVELADRYRGAIPMEVVPVSGQSPVEERGGVYALDTLVAQAHAARARVGTAQPARILTLGGDCGVEIVPVSYLNARYDGRVAVLWFDAHADSNDVATSPSGNFHGMPLRTLLGDGPERLLECAYSTLRSEQVFPVGTRSVDPGERRFLAVHGIETRAPDAGQLAAEITKRGFEYVYLHVDLDVLDPLIFPNVWYPTPHGPTVEVLLATIRRLRERFTIVGGSVLEYISGGAGSLETIDEIVFAGFGLNDAMSLPR